MRKLHHIIYTDIFTYPCPKCDAGLFNSCTNIYLVYDHLNEIKTVERRKLINAYILLSQGDTIQNHFSPMILDSVNFLQAIKSDWLLLLIFSIKKHYESYFVLSPPTIFYMLNNEIVFSSNNPGFMGVAIWRLENWMASCLIKIVPTVLQV